jgi:hypothetical protein
MRETNVIYILILFPAILLAQLPESDVWLFKIKNNQGNLILTEGSNITNRKGYDNQPRFTPDGKSILYVSIREDKQADIFRYHISKKTCEHFTTTKVSEYSPDFSPDGNYVSCVVVEEDSAQRIWLYKQDGSFYKRLNSDIDSGYYAWYSTDTLLYYKLTEPHSLVINYFNQQPEKWICNHPSRTFKKLKGDQFIYAIKDSSEISYRIYNTVIKRSNEYAKYKSRNEDFVWNEKLGLLKSEGPQIIRYDEKLKVWLTLFDFSGYGVKKITRFMLDEHNEQIVIVDNS